MQKATKENNGCPGIGAGSDTGSGIVGGAVVGNPVGGGMFFASFFFQDLHPPGPSQDPQRTNKKSGRMSTFFKKKICLHQNPYHGFRLVGGMGSPDPHGGPPSEKEAWLFVCSA